MVDEKAVDQPIAKSIHDLNIFLIEVANLHIEHGNLDEKAKRVLKGNKDRISPIEIMPPGTGTHPGYIGELVEMLTAGYDEHDAEYRLNRLWNVLGAAFYIGQIDGSAPPEDVAAQARNRKALKDNSRIAAERRFIADYLGEKRMKNVQAESARRLVGPINAAAAKQQKPQFSKTTLHERLKELKRVRRRE